MVSDTAWWIVAFWFASGVAILVCLTAVVILMRDYLQDADNPPRTEIRERLKHLPRR